MNLKKYLLEYVSSGRRKKTGDRIQLGYGREEIVDWLEEHGIRGYSWEDMHALPSCKKGELVYLSGPWDDKDNTQWVLVRNYRGQYVTIYPSTERDLSSFFDVNGSKKEIGFNKCLDVLDKMIKDPNRRIEFNGDMVVEYVSSGRNRVEYPPEHGCDVKDIVDWVKSNGVDKISRYEDGFIKPNPGEILCIIGPNPRPAFKSSQWVKICYCIDKDTIQNVILRPYGDQCTLEIIEKEQYFKKTGTMEFDMAIKIIEELFKKPKRPVLK